MPVIRKFAISSVLIVLIAFLAVHYHHKSTTTSSYLKKGLSHNIYSTVVPPIMDLLSSVFSAKGTNDAEWKNMATVYEFTVKDIDGQDVKLDKYKGKVMLIVNVASKCGFTKGNYKELNELYTKYKDQGLAILGFPCNQFGHQEPGCEVDIKEFIKKNGVEWDMFGKVDVNGDKAIPLYSWLKNKEKGTLIDAIKWNFTKFLINKEGLPVARFAPNKSPLEFEDEVKAELEK